MNEDTKLGYTTPTNKKVGVLIVLVGIVVYYLWWLGWSLIVCLALLIALIIVVLSYRLCTQPRDVFNILILALTAVALVWNTSDAGKATNQVLQQNLRPVILPDFRLSSTTNPNSYWTTFDGSGSGTITLAVYDHITATIPGYVITSKGESQLSFYLSDPNSTGAFMCRSNAVPGLWVSWIPPNEGLCAYFYETSSTVKSVESNKLCLIYRDVDGNEYYTEMRVTHR